MPSIALYYPWMHFQDDNWVKLALLTWDHLARTRPALVADRDSDLVRQVLAESDLIMAVTPSRRDLSLVTDAFTELLRTDRDRIVARFGAGSPSPFMIAPPEAVPAGTDPRSFWVYCGESETKMGNELRDLLVDHELAAESPDGDEWVGLRPELALIYLAVLTDAMSRHNAISPTTDNPRMHRALGAMDQLTELLTGAPGRTPALADATEAYLHLAIQAVIQPEKLAQVPVAKILKFRERHNAELAAFRAHVADLGEELRRVAEVENLEVANAHLRTLYKQQTKPKLDELRRALRVFGVESVAGALALRVGAAGTALGGVTLVSEQPALASAMIAVTAVPFVAGRFRAQRELVNSPVAYLLAADRTLTGGRLLRAIRR